MICWAYLPKNEYPVAPYEQFSNSDISMFGVTVKTNLLSSL